MNCNGRMCGLPDCSDCNTVEKKELGKIVGVSVQSIKTGFWKGTRSDLYIIIKELGKQYQVVIRNLETVEFDKIEDDSLLGFDKKLKNEGVVRG